MIKRLQINYTFDCQRGSYEFYEGGKSMKKL